MVIFSLRNFRNQHISPQDHHENQHGQHGGRLLVGVGLHLEQDDAQVERLGAIEKDRHRQFVERGHEHEKPCGNEAGPHQRQDDVAEALHPACPGDLCRLLQRKIDLLQGGADRADGKGQILDDIGHNQDREGVVEVEPVFSREGDDQRQRDDRPRRGVRDGGDEVRRPGQGAFHLNPVVGDETCHQQGQGRSHDAQEQAVPEGLEGRLERQDVGIVLQAQVLQGDRLPENPDEGGHHDGPDGQDHQDNTQQARKDQGRDLEAAQGHGQHADALSPHEGVTFAAQKAVPEGHGDDGDDHENDRQGRCLPHPRRRPHVDVLDDLRGEHIDAAGHADHGGDPEGGGGGGKDQKPPREEAGGYQGQRDVPEHPQGMGAADAGGLLEGVVHLLEGACHIQKGQRVVEQGHDPHKPGNGVDVEGPGDLGAEGLDQYLVDVPHTRGEQQDPGDGPHIGGDHVGDKEKGAELTAVRKVAAHHEPGKPGGEDHGEEHGEAADPERRHHGIPVAFLAVDGDVVLEADLPFRPQKAPQDEKDQGKKDEYD